MAVSVDWAQTQVITVPRNDMTLIQSSPTEIRELDTNAFRLELRDLEEDEDGGRPWPRTHDHNTDVVISGLNYARQIIILEPYTITFEDGQYAVNLVGSNNNILDRTNKNQVSVNPSNSAGLISSQDSQAAAFNGGVVLDVNNISGKAVAGTENPTGQLRRPSNNLIDASIIKSFRGLLKIFVLGDVVVSNEASFVRTVWVGENALRTEITLNPEAVVDDCRYENATITGQLDGNSVAVNCFVHDLLYVEGILENCGIGNIELSGNNMIAKLWDCKSTFPGTPKPTINCNNNGILDVRGYKGGMRVIGYSGSGEHTIQIEGTLELPSTEITGGVWVIRGDCKIVDENGNILYGGNYNGATIINESSHKVYVAYQTWKYNLPDGRAAEEALVNAGDSGSPWEARLIPSNTKPNTFGEMVGVKLPRLLSNLFNLLRRK